MTVLLAILVALAAWCVCALVVGLVVGRLFALGSRPGRDEERAATSAVPVSYEA